MKKRSILITGYFYQNNLGDDLFVEVWKYIALLPAFAAYEMRYVATSELTSEDINTCDCIILGGGDVFVDFFFNKLRSLLQLNSNNKKKKKILLAFSVGIPYNSIMIKHNDLLENHFHAITFRSRTDTVNMQSFFPSIEIKYFPDLSTYLPLMYRHNQEQDNDQNSLLLRRQQYRDVIGVSLVRDIIDQGYNVYSNFVNEFAQFLNIIAKKHNDKDFILLPFCTPANKPSQNDILIFNDILDKIKVLNSGNNCNNNNLTNISIASALTVSEMWTVYNDRMIACITMRYHAHMYAIAANVPLLSISSTRKVKNLLKDVDLLEYNYSDWKYDNVVANVNNSSSDNSNTYKHVDHWIDLFDRVLNNKSNICTKMAKYIQTMDYEYHENVLLRHIAKCCELSDNNNNTIPTSSIKRKDIISIIKEHPTTNIRYIIRNIVEYIDYFFLQQTQQQQDQTIQKPNAETFAEMVLEGRCTFLERVLQHQRRVSTNILRTIAKTSAALVCYSIMHTPFPKYHYGLASKIMGVNFKPKADFEWIIDDYLKSIDNVVEEPVSSSSNNNEKAINATYAGVDDFKGQHRSGWQYVVENIIKNIHNPTAELIMDNYVDRSFLWAYDVYKYLGVVPYSKPWCGFLHHTFDTSYSSNNLEEMFSNDGFRESLSNCRALFTMSEYLTNQVKQRLETMGVSSSVKVFTFTHPTMIDNVPVWRLDKFVENPNPYIVQIGAWLRDNYAIYELCPYEKSGVKTLQKAALVGRNMNQYFKPDNIRVTIEEEFENGNNNTIAYYNFNDNDDIFAKPDENKFILGALKTVKKQWKSVKLIENLNNEEYDELLTKNIVFINLVDASAVNTIIECIVRNTPILVNKHPAAIEMLGYDYPLLYNDITDAGVKAGNYELIFAAWNYLKNIDKSKFSIESFIMNLKKTITALL